MIRILTKQLLKFNKILNVYEITTNFTLFTKNEILKVLLEIDRPTEYSSHATFTAIKFIVEKQLV